MKRFMTFWRCGDGAPVVALLLGSTGWGLFWYPLRWFEEQGLSGLWIILLFYAAASLVGLPWAWRQRATIGKQRSRMVGLLLTSGWCNAAFIVAVLEGEVVRVTLLFFLSPIWALLLGYWLLKEPLSRQAVISTALAMVGAVTMLWNPALGVPWPLDGVDVLALSAGFAFALANVFARGAPEVALAVKTETVWLGVVLLAGCGLIAGPSQALPVATAPLLAAVIFGASAIVLLTLATQLGVSRLPVQRSAVILLWELVAAAISAQWLTEESLMAQEWLGGALIAIAGWYCARLPSGEAEAASLPAAHAGQRR